MKSDEEKLAAILKDGIYMIEELGKMKSGGESTPAEIAESDQRKKAANDLLDHLIGGAAQHIERGVCNEADCTGPPTMILMAAVQRNAPDDFLLAAMTAVYRLATQRVKGVKGDQSEGSDEPTP